MYAARGTKSEKSIVSLCRFTYCIDERIISDHFLVYWLRHRSQVYRTGKKTSSASMVTRDNDKKIQPMTGAPTSSCSQMRKSEETPKTPFSRSSLWRYRVGSAPCKWSELNYICSCSCVCWRTVHASGSCRRAGVQIPVPAKVGTKPSHNHPPGS